MKCLKTVFMALCCFRTKEWVNNCRRQDLMNKSAEYLYNNCKLCAEHFEDCMFTNHERNRLNTQAKPTLFKIPNPPPKVGQKRRAINNNEAQAVISGMIQYLCA